MKRLLIISPHWPPINAPDLQRVRMSLPYYRQFGWEPVVLAVHPDDVAGTREPELEQTYPADIRIVRCRALPLRWTRWLGLGNLGLRAWWALRREGNALLHAEHFDLVFFATTQFITFTLGPGWRRRFGTPYVIDLQDPWRTDYYERLGAPSPPGGRKYFLARLLAALLEGRVYRLAAGFVSVSEHYLAALAKRYPWFQTKPQATIRFGVSQADFEQVRRRPPSGAKLAGHPGQVHLLYTGAAGPIMPRALDFLFEGFARYRSARPERAARFLFHFVGTSYVPPGHGKPVVLPVAREHGLADFVDEVPHRVGYLESLEYLMEADGLMLLGSSDLAYSPSKLYPYYLSGKPILAVVFAQSQLEGLLNDLACSWLVSLAEPDQHTANQALAAFFDWAAAGFSGATRPARNDTLFNRACLAEPLARQQCELFERALPAARAPRPTN